MKSRLQTDDSARRDAARRVRSFTPETFRAEMSTAGVRRAFISFENGQFTLSHPQLLEPLRSFFELSPDFDHHEAIFIEDVDRLGTLFFAFVHDTRRGLAQGGLRFWRYDNLASLLVDGLRLAQGMTRKNALAGLWWGGGKGIIQLPSGYERPEHLPLESDLRKEIFEAYGAFVASLGGVYYTAEDVGTKTPDMDRILSRNRFVTCIDRALGGSGNPSPHTALGVLRGIEAAWKFLNGQDSLEGVRVAVQGVGNVGAPLVANLVRAGARVWIADLNQEAVQALVSAYPDAVGAVAPDLIYDLDVDVFSPCALGATVNQDTIPRLRARLVCGAANNILREGEIDAQRLAQRGIAFVPDFLCNRMGITNCADEWMGHLEEDIRAAVERVYPDTLRVLRHARQQGVTSLAAANQLADIAASELHPLFGHRGRRIVDHLISTGWHRDGQARSSTRHRSSDVLFRHSADEPTLRSSRRWQQLGRGTGPAIAAAPISASGRPTLASVCSALLMDVRARAQVALGAANPRRVIGSEHGGLTLQLAVERSLPMERIDLERSEFVERCHDAYSANDAAIRDQLHALGIAFDPGLWLDPMEERVGPVVERLFHALADAGRLRWERFLEHRCPRCRTVLVHSDVEREPIRLEERAWISFETATSGPLEVVTYALEQLLGTVAVAVSDPASAYANDSVRHPLSGLPLPVLVRSDLASPAALVAPPFSQADLRLASEAGIPLPESPFDEDGRLLVPGSESALPVEEAQAQLRQLLGGRVRFEAIDVAGERLRCSRCGTRVHPDTSQQLFAHLDDAAERLALAVQGGAIRHSVGPWQEEVLRTAQSTEPWCISRQYWWGNEISSSGASDTPTRADTWVFSTWFSQVAWTLAGLGWPAQAAPAPIEEVFVDHERLRRWVVPSQLVALALFGRPAFRYVHVHGTVQVLHQQRQAYPTEGGEAAAFAEERYRLRNRRTPMRKQLGNVVEPGVLIQRFGADALRLGYLLAGAAEPRQSLLLDESHLRQGRVVVHQIVAKLSGLRSRLRSAPDQEARPCDHLLVELARAMAERTRSALEKLRFGAAADEVAAALRLWTRFADLVMTRLSLGSALGAPSAAVARSLALLRPGFSPLCPYLFERLEPSLFERQGGEGLDRRGGQTLTPLVTPSLRSRADFRAALENIGVSPADGAEIVSLLEANRSFPRQRR
jgi:glutamate dehydrogenase/leucine dehydrogenase/methionyl-tRNA synthetase